jgi:hypothetical protein
MKSQNIGKNKRLATIDEIHEMLERYKSELIADSIGMGVSPIMYCELRDSEPLAWVQPNPRKIPRFYIEE